MIIHHVIAVSHKCDPDVGEGINENIMFLHVFNLNHVSNSSRLLGVGIFGVSKSVTGDDCDDHKEADVSEVLIHLVFLILIFLRADNCS